MICPYTIWVSEGMTAEDDDGNIHKISNPDIRYGTFCTFSKGTKIIVRYDEIISAYETHDDVLKKYQELVEATHGIEPEDSPVEERDLSDYLIGKVTQLDEEPSVLIENCYRFVDGVLEEFPRSIRHNVICS